MITSLSIAGLNGKIDKTLQFHPDLNILTGKNGSGKTTILKLLWYLISGNIERIPREMSFREIELNTTEFSISIKARELPGESKLRDHIVKYTIGEKTDQKAVSLRNIEEEIPFVRRANRAIAGVRPSVFFSTFRRIEGGFGTTTIPDSPAGLRHRPRSDEEAYYVYMSTHPVDLQRPLNELSHILSVGKHRFVSSISTDDIVALLTEEYANVSEATNKKHGELNKYIFDAIATYSSVGRKSDSEQLSEAKTVLENIRSRVEVINIDTQTLLKPFNTLSMMIDQIYGNRSIRITDAVVLGSSSSTISSHLLSSGEKQILSFLCYNAFSHDIPIFIDEPELSLHVDWQRILFSMLLSQGTNNQFLTATHSPFIYSKYPDKELPLDEDRGE